jgi:hypothetical protein
MPISFRRFLTLRVVAGIALGIVVLWGVWAVLRFFEEPDGTHVREHGEMVSPHAAEEARVDGGHEATVEPGSPDHKIASSEVPTAEHDASSEHGAPDISGSETVPSGTHGGQPTPSAVHEAKAKGVAFVEATISVLDYELNERFWGWRRNDILRITDNVESMQLGVLEVVRRTTVTLAERVSRYGMTDAIDKNLENAMNWLMIKPDRYWLPAAEEKYNDSLNELQEYGRRLERGEARFYTRADNLIPLLVSLSDLVGSCDENLVKTEEKDGSPVSWFKVDDYFYYARGVARAMEEILHAVGEDFAVVLEARNGVDLLHHAIHACHAASGLDPWLVTDADLDGILANHRANMAAPVSHIRHYLDALAKVLST